jgi:WD40 repeat protein
MSEPSLRLLDTVPGGGHSGEVYALSYSSDSSFVLSGGWDGQLQLWETSAGARVSSLKVGAKPLSACAFGPNNRTLIAGSMEGVLSAWDAASHELRLSFLAHIRPISSIRFAPDGESFVTTSWDKQVALRKVGKEREPKVLYGHGDIVAGSAFSTDGKLLLSWSYEGSVIFWDVGLAQQVWATPRHAERVQGGAIGPDGRWAVTASRDGELRLWDLDQRAQAGALKINGELRGCWFLLDGESVLAVTADGWVGVLAVPNLAVRTELLTGLKVECGAVAPPGSQLALGCADGQVHLAQIEGLEHASLVVTATQSVELRSTLFGRLFGKTRPHKVFHYACPVCQHVVETPQLPAQPFPCPSCSRRLRVNAHVCELQSH